MRSEDRVPYVATTEEDFPEIGQASPCLVARPESQPGRGLDPIVLASQRLAELSG